MPVFLKGLLLFIFFSTNLYAYELVIIQGMSKEKQTFVTRGGKNKGIFQGKNYTFTSNNVSVIAKAITVSREFTQWELKNDYTDVPFRKGEIVTMYDTTEYLWALNPGEAQRKAIKKYTFKSQRSLEAHLSFARGISESTSEAIPQNVDRGGYHFDGMYRKELSHYWAFAFGLRYVREVLNTPFASLINQRFLGIVEARYYFDPLYDFYNARIGLGISVGYGQSRTEASGQASFGNAVLLPGTRLSLTMPINDTYEVDFFGAYDSIRLDEGFADGNDQTTNMTNSKLGVIFRKHI